MHGAQDQGVAVDVSGLTVGYERGKPVLQDFSVRFGAGLVLVRGSNGSGKSTLLEACSGYLRPWQGSVTVGGVDAGDQQARALRRVCRTQQSLYPTMTVREHLALASRCLRLPVDEPLARARRYGLGDWVDQEARALSTGNSRKLWVIMCTLGQFDVVLLDEPFNGLDDDASEVLGAELQSWAQDRAVVLIAHAPPERLPVSRVVTMPVPVAA